MKTTQFRSTVLLLATAVIWGIAFVAQSVGMDYVGPFTFSFARSMIGALVLLPCIGMIGKLKSERSKITRQDRVQQRKTLMAGGLLCGICLFAATNFQQVGIQYTTVGKSGFITACYIVLVPVLGMLIGKKTGPLIWLAVLAALAGLYLLCIKERFTINIGDLLTLVCAVIFSIHILVIDRFSPLTDGVKLACVQFFVCGILSGIVMLLVEKPDFRSLIAAAAPILYAGVLSNGVAYTLQIIGQNGMNPTVASLLLSLESCISVLAAWIILGQRLSIRELTGCAVMFGAIILAQLPGRSTANRKKDRIGE